MIAISYKKVLSILSNGFNKVKDGGKKAFGKLQEDISYIKESQCATLTKTNKNIFVLPDKNLQVIYFKEIDLIQKIKHIKENDTIKIDDNTYQIVKIDTNKYDYLLKRKEKYKTLSCYKILVNKI